MQRPRLAAAAIAAVLAPPLAAQVLTAPGPVPQVTVTGTPLGSSLFELAVPASSLESPALQFRGATTLGETVNTLPGVSSSYFGPNASRPVIRGLDGDRIRILQNGVGSLDASSLSFDHATAVEPIAVDRIEVVRGPAALLYGGSAVGGVVNVIDRRIPTRRIAGINGALEARVGGAEREGALAASLDAGNGRFAIHADVHGRRTRDLIIPGLQRSQFDRENGVAPPYCNGTEPAGRACNSSSRGEGASLGGGLTWDHGHAGMSFTQLRSHYGTVVEPTVRIGMRSDTWNLASEVRELGTLLNTLRVKFAHTDYQHTEFDDGAAQTTFKNRGHEARAELTHRAIGPFSAGAVGVQLGRSDFSAIGTETLIPETRSRADALFVYEEITAGALTLSLGGRYERASVRSAGGGPNEADPTLPLFGAPRYGGAQTRVFNLASGSIGAVYRLAPAYALAANLAYSERAPTYYELYANGPHAATGAYEVGNAAFAKETSTSLDVALRYRNGGTSFSVGAFRNRFRDFISLAASGRQKDENGDPALVGSETFNEFVYRQVPAVFQGFEAEGRTTVLSRPGATLVVDARADYVHATNKATGEPIPRVAPLRTAVGLTWFSGAWTVRGELQAAASQRRVPQSQSERQTGEYALVNLHAGYRFSLGGTRAFAFARLTNLGNATARLATSQLREIVPLGGRALAAGVRLEF
ncbi:MAG: TonB-dependent receptor [Burkholderiales bacterium]|nr:TonB-dependent receptor [Burkholderiales bacterium]